MKKLLSKIKEIAQTAWSLISFIALIMIIVYFFASSLGFHPFDSKNHGTYTDNYSEHERF